MTEGQSLADLIAEQDLNRKLSRLRWHAAPPNAVTPVPDDIETETETSP